MRQKVQFATESERIFAGYLDEWRYEWEYEPQFPGKLKRPDFRVRHCEVECLLDAKERSKKPTPDGARNFDPIKGVRAMIHSGRDKFKEFGDHLCALVLYNNGDCDTRLDPLCVYGAMLGDPGFTWSVDPIAGIGDSESTREEFLNRGGEMIRHYEPCEPHDSSTNISSIVVPRHLRPRNPDFSDAYEQEAERQRVRCGRDLSPDESFEIQKRMIWDGSIPMRLGEETGVIVYINPFARHALPDSFLNGPYDERWSIENGSLQRVFAGSELIAVEDVEGQNVL